MEKSTSYVVLRLTVLELVQLAELMPKARLTPETLLESNGNSAYYHLFYKASSEACVIETLISQKMLPNLARAQESFVRTVYNTLLAQRRTAIETFKLVRLSQVDLNQLKEAFVEQLRDEMLKNLSELFKLHEEYLRGADIFPYLDLLVNNDFDYLYQASPLKPAHYSAV